MGTKQRSRQGALIDLHVRSVESQLSALQRIGRPVGKKIREEKLQQAYAFEPVASKDQPLVTGAFGYDIEWWNLHKWGLLTPGGYRKEDGALVQHVTGLELLLEPEIQVVHFQLGTDVGLPADDALAAATKDGQRSAGIEIYESAILAPESIKFWPSRLLLSGLRSSLDGVLFDRVPCAYRVDSEYRVDLNARPATLAERLVESARVFE